MSTKTLTYTVLFLSLAAPGTAYLAPTVAAEQAVPSEKNPPGDIPDTQVFVHYNGAGFSMKVPEGWSRTDRASGAVFADKYNTISVSVSAAPTAPTVATITNGDAKSLAASGRAVVVGSIKAIKLDGGQAIRVDYTANSEPNAVTNKQIRLEEVRFYLFGNGRVVTLDMSAPKGADNVDQWNLMANSLRVK